MSEYIYERPDEPAKVVRDGWNVRIEWDFKQREKIVRCRDCKHYVEDPDPIDPGWPMMCEDSGRDMVDPDGFCAWGERRGDA